MQQQDECNAQIETFCCVTEVRAQPYHIYNWRTTCLLRAPLRYPVRQGSALGRLRMDPARSSSLHWGDYILSEEPSDFRVGIAIYLLFRNSPGTNRDAWKDEWIIKTHGNQEDTLERETSTFLIAQPWLVEVTWHQKANQGKSLRVLSQKGSQWDWGLRGQMFGLLTGFLIWFVFQVWHSTLFVFVIHSGNRNGF